MCVMEKKNLLTFIKLYILCLRDVYICHSIDFNAFINTIIVSESNIWLKVRWIPCQCNPLEGFKIQFLPVMFCIYFRLFLNTFFNNFLLFIFLFIILFSFSFFSSSSKSSSCSSSPSSPSSSSSSSTSSILLLEHSFLHSSSDSSLDFSFSTSFPLLLRTKYLSISALNVSNVFLGALTTALVFLSKIISST